MENVKGEYLPITSIILLDENPHKKPANYKTVLICKCCNKSFYSNKLCKTRIPKYCSKKCSGLDKRQIKTCSHCNKEYYHSRSYENKGFCSCNCAKESRIGKSLSKEWKLALSEGRKASHKCKGKNLYNWKGGKETLIERNNLYRLKRKTKLKIKIDLEFTKKIIKAQHGNCFYCDKELNHYKALDHLTPVSKGGDNYTNNLVYSCKQCNSRKAANNLIEFSKKTKRIELIDRHIQLCKTLNITIPTHYLAEGIVEDNNAV